MINDKQYSFDSQVDDFNYCENIIKKHSKTFYFAFSQLSKKKAKSIYAVYAFCREADDLVDNQKDTLKLDDLLSKLKLFDKGVIPDEPVWRALSVVFAEYSIDIQPFYDMLIGQKKDLKFTQPKTYDDLKDYSYFVAGSVGLMLLPILSQHSNEIKFPAKQLGEAMQITNILRDIGEDLNMNRIYLPQEMMVRYEVTEEVLKNKVPTANFIKLWENLANKAEELYDSSMSMLPLVDEDAREPLLLALYVYREILNEIRRNDYHVFKEKHYVGKIRKLQIAKKVKKQVKLIY